MNIRMDNAQRLGEVIEASTTDFTAQCFELFQSPPLGSLVKTIDESAELFGIVCHATTASLETGRRPIARGKDETNDEAIYQSNPQLLQLLRSEFSVLVVGHKKNEKLYYYLPPKPARIHSFVYLSSTDEMKEFSQSFDFLNVLLNSHLLIPTEELVAAALRQISQVFEDPYSFLVTAGKELAILLGGDFNQIKTIMGKLKQ
ncbi:MAG: hypothetical protein PHQ86_03000 [Dehalococcoidales bacterium]|nr:hypothetical protein [Dehalococcoidales bacterium]